jgi:hypothetical protein
VVHGRYQKPTKYWALMVTHILIIGCRIDSATYRIMTDTVHRLNKRIKDKFKNSQRSVIYLLCMHSEPLLFTIKAALKDVSRFCSDIYDYTLNVPPSYVFMFLYRLKE